MLTFTDHMVIQNLRRNGYQKEANEFLDRCVAKHRQFIHDLQNIGQSHYRKYQLAQNSNLQQSKPNYIGNSEQNYFQNLGYNYGRY